MENKRIPTGITSTKTGSELVIREAGDETGIIDVGGVSGYPTQGIYWKTEDIPKLIKKLQEVI
jgi:hypothetical protein